MNHVVTLIVDRDFGGQIKGMVQESDVWIIESEKNSLIAQSVWNSTVYRDPKNEFELTSFKALDGESSEEACKRIIDEVDTHHPDWKEIKVIGAKLDEGLKKEFEEFEATEVLEEGGIIRVLAS